MPEAMQSGEGDADTDPAAGSWLTPRASRIPRAALAVLGGVGSGTLVALLVLGLRWVPDCGGVAYGFPLPWLQTNMGSSMEFYWSPLALLLDGMVLGLPVMIGLAWALHALARRSRFVWVVLAAGGQLSWLGALPLLLLLCFVPLYTPTLLLSGPVFEWREVSPYFGAARWQDHLERQCN